MKWGLYLVAVETDRQMMPDARSSVRHFVASVNVLKSGRHKFVKACMRTYLHALATNLHPKHPSSGSIIP